GEGVFDEGGLLLDRLFGSGDWNADEPQTVGGQQCSGRSEETTAEGGKDCNPGRQ
ncbi:hypothetical protein E4U43_006596, partial [Claviceps pusilla]